MRKDSTLGSSSSTDRVLVGAVTKAHGLRGHVVVRSESDHPQRFARGSSLQADDGRSLVVDAVSQTERGLLVRFEGVHDRDSAEALAGTRLWIAESERRDLNEGEFWPDELIGLDVFDAGGELVGTVTAVIEGVGQDRLEVETRGGARAEVPLVEELVTKIDISGGCVVISAIDGLIEPQ